MNMIVVRSFMINNYDETKLSIGYYYNPSAPLMMQFDAISVFPFILRCDPLRSVAAAKIAPSKDVFDCNL